MQKPRRTRRKLYLLVSLFGSMVVALSLVGYPVPPALPARAADRTGLAHGQDLQSSAAVNWSDSAHNEGLENGYDQARGRTQHSGLLPGSGQGVVDSAGYSDDSPAFSPNANSLLFIENAGQWPPSPGTGQALSQTAVARLGERAFEVTTPIGAGSLSPTASPEHVGLAYAGFLGGSDTEEGRGIAVDGAGNAYVMGWTQSSDFPTTSSAFDASYGGFGDAFVSKLSVATAGPSAAALWTDQPPAIDGDFTDWGH